MRTIKLRHDQEKKTTTVHMDGEAISLNCLGTGEGHSLSDWKDRLFPELVEKCRLGPDRGCELLFWGLEDDFRHIESALKDFSGTSSQDIEITLRYEGLIPEAVLKCRKCGHELKPNWIKCPKCKTPVVEERRKCRYCGEELEEWMDECPACGKPVSGTAPGEAEDHKARALDAAKKDHDRAIKPNPKKAAAYHNQGAAYFDQGNLDAAIKDYTRAIKLDPEDASVYFDRGLAYYFQGNLDAAKKDYDRATKLDPKSTAAYHSITTGAIHIPIKGTGVR
jgi:tetratricopeptide (TPR) repeat protein